MLSLDAVPRHGEAVIDLVVEGEAILLNLDNGYYYSLDPIGSEIWSMCDGNCSLQGVADRVCAEYDVAWDQAQRDLLELIDDLQREGLITIHGMAEQTGPAAS
jgi:hypothetical protein